MDLRSWGYYPSFEVPFGPHAARGLVPGRVVFEANEIYRVVTSDGELLAEPTGRLRHAATGPEDLPVVGDWVACDVFPGQGTAVVHAILERRSRIARRAPGAATRPQILAANVDAALVLAPLDRTVNPRGLVRYVAMARDGGVPAWVLLSKSDLAPPSAAAVRDLEEQLGGTPILLASCVAENGLAAVEAILRPCATAVLLGPSGAGKSTLLNRLLGTERQATAPVRASDGKGRHTTAARQLVQLPSGVLLLDTPGLRAVAPWDASDLVAEAVDASDCRFRDCRHEGEPGCALRERLDAGQLEALARLRREDDFLRIREREGAARAERMRWRRMMGGSLRPAKGPP